MTICSLTKDKHKLLVPVLTFFFILNCLRTTHLLLLILVSKMHCNVFLKIVGSLEEESLQGFLIALNSKLSQPNLPSLNLN